MPDLFRYFGLLFLMFACAANIHAQNKKDEQHIRLQAGGSYEAKRPDTIISSSNTWAAYTKVKLDKKVDSIVVIKATNEMYVYHQKTLLKVYRISLGAYPEGPKQFEGDKRTPEGIYHVSGKNTQSEFYKSLGIDYPSRSDVAFAKKNNDKPGGDIKIHGLPNKQKETVAYYTTHNWTSGCVGVTNDEIDELFEHVAPGTCVNFLP